MNKVFILTPDSQKFVQMVEAKNLPQLEIFASNHIPSDLELMKRCNIILGKPVLVAQILPQAPQIEWVQSSFAGIEALCDPQLPTDYTLTGIKEIFNLQMSEYVFLYILARERNFLKNLAHQQKQIWHDIPSRGLQGLTMGVCGFGSIGQHIAQTATHFGMKVFGFNNRGTPHPYAKKMFNASSIEAFLPPLDYLVITLPSTPQTRHLFDYSRFQQMKSSAVLVNIGRGNVVNEKDLIQALQEKVIQGAILDVFEEEPLSPESLLWKMPEVFITPHNSAASFPEEISEIFADNYRRFLKHEPLQYVIDRKKGY